MTEQIHIGQRIKFFREQRGLTQKQLGNGAGLLEASIRKYEIGQRNPKPDQIKKIADALGVTVYALAPPEIETDADIISLILAIDEKVGINFDGKKDSKRKINPKTLTLHIDDYSVNDALARWGNAKNQLEKMKTEDVPKAERKGHQAAMAEYEADIEEAKIGLMNSSHLITKDGHIAVKINPDFSRYKK
ncbi:MAG: helix-turn-helix domain-containing protein [Clostridiales Family XIII bacterium]|jgi:transcriptional regulator with XRE-family HTH domain|nr:helix-turn-helix domain-containing protein [Clostridiales Family XIII bacterium]